jgi:hypothetical protein
MPPRTANGKRRPSDSPVIRSEGRGLPLRGTRTHAYNAESAWCVRESRRRSGSWNRVEVESCAGGLH